MTGIRVRELAEIVGGSVDGPDDIPITGAASISDAEQGDIVLAEDQRYFDAAARCKASAILAESGACEGKSVIHVDNPRKAFVEILKVFAPVVSAPRAGIDPNCRVGERIAIGKGASVGYGSYIGDDVSIGDGTIIHPLVFLGDGVRIGAGCVIHPNVTIYFGCELGSNVTVHSGTVIGSDGFGYIPVDGRLSKVPQIGNVVIEDDVEIGSCTTVDRAKTGSTRIGRGSKIDNLVQIAHNVKIGESSVIVAQVGIAGSAEIGSGVTIAGQAGVKNHIKIGDGVVVAAQSAIFGDLPSGGGMYSGYPARPHKEALRAQAVQLRLPELQKTVEMLKKEVEQLTRRLAQLGGEEIESQSK
ncbi:MAG: UDP-3-O-(3-hydroxymyristoyl)glucosamine N-acyltransferase [Armatimonadota bacterium]